MKFKNIRQLAESFSQLNEWGDERVAPEWNTGAPVGDVNSEHMYPQSQCSKDRLNFWLKNMNPSNKPVFCVNEHLNSIRLKMNLLGYDIQVNNQTEISDHMEFEIKQFGGRSGMNEQGQVFSDDGISHNNNGKGLKLVVDVNSVDGAKIINSRIEEN